ncbi:hypothetical protein KIN20_007779 [Parelaphostrongylus tenuis]|uniref:CMP/dCMP-type deaminase domain-containing protein n=1 Tax=Parelaphostrongylus tenuis TaxID=148309 RepID=A0AAD5M701_PARTN|nr:hypothetical protein KIN20_007779 [Parelaphostrongylus tenuis]
MADGLESQNDDRKFMRRAFQLAQEALDNGEVPVGCVFTYKDVEVGYGRNEVNCSKNPTAHAEMVALNRMQSEVPNIEKIIRDLVLYVTLEPCVMCASGLYELGISKIVYGAANERFGGIKSVGNSRKYNLGDCKIEIVEGVDADRSIALLKSFYAKENPFAPEDKKKVKKQSIQET